MKKSKALGISFLWIVLFFGIQILISIAASVGSYMGNPGNLTSSLSTTLSATLILSNAATAVCVILVSMLHGDSLGKELNLKKTSPLNIVIAFLFAATLAPVVSWLLDLIPFPESWLEFYGTLMETAVGDDNLATAFSTVILGPVCEELVFRGAIFNTLKKAFKTSPAVIITALLFGFVHLNPIQSSYAFVLGIILCLLCIRFNSLWASIAAHIAFNLIGGYFDIYALEDNAFIAVIAICAIAAVIIGAWMIMTRKSKKQ